MSLKLIRVLFCLLYYFCVCDAFRNLKLNSDKSSYSLEGRTSDQTSKILVSIIIGNNSYSLPTFLKTLESLKCVTESDSKCDLWVVFDRSTDKSHEMFIYWLENTRQLFNTITMIKTLNDMKTREQHVGFNSFSIQTLNSSFLLSHFSLN